MHKKNLHYWRKIEVVEWLFKAGFFYKKLIRQNNYDLVHAFFGFPTAYLCYKSTKILPYIISLRGSDVPGYNVRLGMDYKLLSPLFRRIWRRSKTRAAGLHGPRIDPGESQVEPRRRGPRYVARKVSGGKPGGKSRTRGHVRNARGSSWRFWYQFL